jgi:Uncharacterized protein conserved in bacteria
VPSAKQKRRPDAFWLSDVGAQVKQARQLAGLTQEALAEKTGLAPRTIQKIEAGDITILITTLRRLREAIGCRFDDLLPD